MSTQLQNDTSPTKVTGSQHFATEFNALRSKFNGNNGLIGANKRWINSETDLINTIAEGASAEGFWFISSNVTMTGNRTIQSGVTLVYNGGYINPATFTLTGTNTKVECGCK